MRAVREDWPVGCSASLSLQEGWARPTTKALGRAGQGFALGNSSVSGDPRSPVGVRTAEANRNSPREGALGTKRFCS